MLHRCFVRDYGHSVFLLPRHLGKSAMEAKINLSRFARKAAFIRAELRCGVASRVKHAAKVRPAVRCETLGRQDHFIVFRNLLLSVTAKLL